MAINRLKSLRIDAGTANQADVAGIDQAGVLKRGLVVGILHDQAAVRAAESQPQQGANGWPQQAGFEAIAGEDMAKASDGVDASGDAGQAGSQCAVNHAFDGEVVNQVRPFLGVDPADVVEQGQFTQRIQAAPLHRDGQGAKTSGLEFGDIGTGRREHHDFMTLVTEIAGQRQAEVVEIPFGVGEEEDFHFFFLATIPTPIPKIFGKNLTG